VAATRRSLIRLPQQRRRSHAAVHTKHEVEISHGLGSKKPPLEDPLHEKEIFASEVAGITMVHGRRVVLTNVAASQLLQSLQNIAAQIQAAASIAAGHKPN
jgi:hypothetical protein